MKSRILLAAILSCVAVVITGNSLASSSARSVQEKESLKEPADIMLCPGCSDGDVPFNHTNHSTKNYSPDGTSPIKCVECHHTDQPAASLKAPLKTSERDATLTSAMLLVAGAKPVKTCHACHFNEADRADLPPAEVKLKLPSITYPGQTVTTPLDDKEASHKNCKDCHDKAVAARPALKDKVPPSKDCKPCHKP